MICRCFGRSLDLGQLGRQVRETANLMVGVPDYDRYVAHIAATHPDQTPMDRVAFAREREAARFGEGRALRCC